MNEDYIVAPAALDDIDEIATWMRRENPGSDVDLFFIEEAYKAFGFIAKRPTTDDRTPAPRPDQSARLFLEDHALICGDLSDRPARRDRSHSALAARFGEPPRRR